MKREEFKRKKITVMGLGLNNGGIGTVRFLHSLGAKIIVTDMKSKEELTPSIEKIKDLKNIEYIFGQHRTEDFSNVDMVIKTPGVSWNNKYVKLALENNIPVEVDASLFFKLCKNKVVGITGTKGKTTTSSLIFEILKVAGKKPVKVGIGQFSVLDKLNEIEKESIVVFELSSWRLSALGRYKISPKIAVFTNLYPDHLNYYSGMESYLRDKKYIFENQKSEDFCIINWDNHFLNKLENEIKSQIIKFSKNKISESKAIYLEKDSIYINNGIDEKKVIDISEIKIIGEHNIENVMAAIGAAYALGIETKEIKKAITEFKGISYRLEFVREFNGISFFNDTTATTPESAISGINSFQKPIVLICGGADKKLDMKDLAKVIKEKTKAAIFFKGEATNKIISELKNITGKSEEDFIVVDSMEKALAAALRETESGDVVLLSPGSASFGIFQNEFDRGNKFKEAVNRL